MMNTDNADVVDDATEGTTDIESKSCPSALTSSAESAAGEINVSFIQDFPRGTTSCESVGKKDAAAVNENGKEDNVPRNHQSTSKPSEFLFFLID